MDVSLKDGYAVKSGDIENATPESPVLLTLSGTIAAGGARVGKVMHGRAVRVLTGAELAGRLLEERGVEVHRRTVEKIVAGLAGARGQRKKTPPAGS